MRKNQKYSKEEMYLAIEFQQEEVYPNISFAPVKNYRKKHSVTGTESTKREG